MSEKTLPSPLYAAAAVGDLVAKKLQKWGPELQKKADALPKEAQRLAGEAPDTLRRWVRTGQQQLGRFATDIPSYAAQLRQFAQAKAERVDTDAMRERARGVRQNIEVNVKAVGGKALSLYGGLVARGKALVDERDANGAGTSSVSKRTVVAPTTQKQPVSKTTVASGKKKPTSKATKPAKSAKSVGVKSGNASKSTKAARPAATEQDNKA